MVTYKSGIMQDYCAHFDLPSVAEVTPAKKDCLTLWVDFADAQCEAHRDNGFE